MILLSAFKLIRLAKALNKKDVLQQIACRSYTWNDFSVQWYSDENDLPSLLICVDDCLLLHITSKQNKLWLSYAIGSFRIPMEEESVPVDIVDLNFAMISTLNLSASQGSVSVWSSEIENALVYNVALSPCELVFPALLLGKIRKIRNEVVQQLNPIIEELVKTYKDQVQMMKEFEVAEEQNDD